ncbi:MAG: CSLREA domain-containing protein [Geminicoccaceae bacterium]
MATFTVTTLTDTVDPNDGKLSLREALTLANAKADADTVTFAASLEGKTLTLTHGQIDITNDVTVLGDPDKDGTGVVIDQRTDDTGVDVSARVLEISGTGTDAALSGMGLTGGRVIDENGGGILVSKGANLDLHNVSVHNNSLGLYDAPYTVRGIGIYANANASLTIVASDISHNSSATENVLGGGIAVGDHSNLVLQDSIVNHNDAQFGAGVLINGAAQAVVLRSDVINNIASGMYEGGHAGIYAWNTMLDITDSTIADNIAYASDGSWGGGISGSNVTLTLTSSTVTGNSVGADTSKYATALGAGVYLEYSSIALANSVVAGNYLWSSSAPLRTDDISGQAITTSNGHNVLGKINGGSVEGDVVGVDPALIFAALNPTRGGGQLVLVNGTWVAPLRDALDNPALSGADPASTGEVDQRGAARPQPGASNPDIGSYELSQTHISTTASAHNDVLTGTAAANTLAGKAGNDLLLGLGGNDTLKGESGGDTLQGGLGDDKLDGGTGIDTASYRDATAAVTVSLKNGTSGGALGHDTLVSIENVVGSALNDSLGGDAGSNTVAGLAGNDKLYGDVGNDHLRGGAGSDSLWGGLGNDDLDGGAGIDTAVYADATGAVGANLLKGTSSGALGSDHLTAIENLTGGAFNDTLGGDRGANTLLGGGGNDKLYGDAGNDDLQGQDGNDTLWGFTGDDRLDGGAGTDTASYADITGAGVHVSLAITTAQDTGGAGHDTLAAVENLIGTALADSLVGNSAANTLTGGLGKDTLTGNAGNDLFDYNTAADSGPAAKADWITDFTGAGAATGDRIDLADVYAGTLKFVGTHAFDAAGEVRVTASGSDTIVQVNLTGTGGAEMEIHVQDGAATPGQWAAGDFIL